ncbi:hypothetical protein [Quadrisphaera sp. INWT6]|uniref:hypothetical protein n=1 Tax=Quadrisphaera sp. INWT6 TaxID=2596917 RepID=UPI0018924B85|nr:hypothetical protein [Quadrisphaera sp. INWT6]MBF5082165.1 hypothetical protein [Quadrisphaera sp. INWT6]
MEVTEPAVAWNQDDVDAFYGAGYTYADAVALAELWRHPGDATYAKVTGGADLRSGTSLPVLPGSTPDLIGQDPAWGAFTSAGHDVEDALELARVWAMPSGYSAALKAGRELTAGLELPEPMPSAVSDVQDGRARQAWVAAGYDDQDAQELAELWALGTPDQAVLAGGYNLQGGQTVPVQP